MLLVIVVISQMVVEALLYDLRYPSRGGTCSIASYEWTNTTNITITNETMTMAYGTSTNSPNMNTSIMTNTNTTTATSGSFPGLIPEPLVRQLVASITGVLLSVQVVLLCFQLLYKVAMAKRAGTPVQTVGTSDFQRLYTRCDGMSKSKNKIAKRNNSADPTADNGNQQVFVNAERSKNKEINERKKGAGTSHQMRRKVGLDAWDAWHMSSLWTK